MLHSEQKSGVEKERGAEGRCEGVVAVFDRSSAALLPLLFGFETFPPTFLPSFTPCPNNFLTALLPKHTLCNFLLPLLSFLSFSFSL